MTHKRWSLDGGGFAWRPSFKARNCAATAAGSVYQGAGLIRASILGDLLASLSSGMSSLSEWSVSPAGARQRPLLVPVAGEKASSWSRHCAADVVSLAALPLVLSGISSIRLRLSRYALWFSRFCTLRRRSGFVVPLHSSSALSMFVL